MFPGSDRWYFSREEIENNSPSRPDGIDLKEETRLRKSYCSFLKDLGARLELHQEAIVTAMLFCHRFFLRQSHAKNDRWTIATVCMFLSAKVESTPQDLKHIIVVSNEILHKKIIATAEQRQEVYEQNKELHSIGEKLVLSTLNFDLTVDLPYQPLTRAMRKYILDKDTQAQFPQLAWKFIHDSFWTTLCLQYQPRHVAACAFFLAAKHIKMDVESYGETWCQEFDITPTQLNDMRGQMDELYYKEKPSLASKGRIGETSNNGDVTDMASTDKCPSTKIEGVSSNVNDGSVQDKWKTEGVEKDSPGREAPAAETSDD